MTKAGIRAGLDGIHKWRTGVVSEDQKPDSNMVFIIRDGVPYSISSFWYAKFWEPAE
jgi:hypothetical protein